VNSDLANDLGNLVQRTLTMVRNYFGGVVGEAGPETDEDVKVRAGFDGLKARTEELFSDYAINRALEEIWVYLGTVNKYLADHEPWKMAKEPEKRPRLARVLLQAASAIRGISYLLYPVMPGSCDKIWEFLGESKKIRDVRYSEMTFGGLVPGRAVQEPKALFPRVLLKDFLAEERAGSESKTTAAPEPAPAVKEKKMEETPTPATPATNLISYEEFMKMDLRVAKILAAERVPNTNKLFKLEIDLGTEKRTMIAGIADTYTAEDLVGKSLIVIANLKPARIRGIESQAMLLAAVFDDKAVVPFFDRDVPPGTTVK
jgi:methionyl-tRNA synthetase